MGEMAKKKKENLVRDASGKTEPKNEERKKSKAEKKEAVARSLSITPRAFEKTATGSLLAPGR